MTDTGTFEGELSEELRAQVSHIDPDLVTARQQLEARLAAPLTPPRAVRREQRSPLLLVAASAAVVVSGALMFSSLSGRGGEVATVATVLSSIPADGATGDSAEAAPDDDGATTPTSVPTDQANPLGTDELGAAEAESGLAWNDVPAPIADRSRGNATEVTATETEPGDPDGETTIEVMVWTDDGRAFHATTATSGDNRSDDSTATDPALTEQAWPDALATIMSRSSDTPDAAVDALLRSAGVDPDTATTNTIETRTWAIGVTLLSSGNLESDEWSQVLRLLSTIDGVMFLVDRDAAGSGGERVLVRAADRPGGETWSLELDGTSGRPLALIATDRAGDITRLTTYRSRRIDAPQPVAALGAEVQVVEVDERGLRFTGADTGTVSSVTFGQPHDEVATLLTAALVRDGTGAASSEGASSNEGAASDEGAASSEGAAASDAASVGVASCLHDGSASDQLVVAVASWPGLRTFVNAEGRFVGWAITGGSVTTYTGLGVGSTVADLTSVYPGLTLEPHPLGVAAVVDSVVYVATSQNPSSTLSHVSAGAVCEVAGDRTTGDDTADRGASGDDASDEATGTGAGEQLSPADGSGGETEGGSVESSGAASGGASSVDGGSTDDGTAGNKAGNGTGGEGDGSGAGGETGTNSTSEDDG